MQQIVNFRSLTIIASVVFLFMATGCEDEPPTDYIPTPYVQAFLFVDRPVEDVLVMITQPLSEPYKYGNGSVSDANVQIIGGGDTFQLQYREVDGVGSYFYPDTTLTIKPETEYELTVNLTDGTLITASTITPARIAWVLPPHDYIQYPSDTVNLPVTDSLDIEWTKGNNTEYLIRVITLDTLNYGAYLPIPTTEINERTNNLDGFIDAENPRFYSLVRWGFIQTTRVATVWTAFGWYGKSEVSVIAADKHFLNWFKLNKFSGDPKYDYELSNVTGGIGIFASGSIVSWESFLYKWK